MGEALPPTRAAGLARLAEFVPRAAAYGEWRNFDEGPDGPCHVSRLSPYLRTRLIAEDEVTAAVLRVHKAATVRAFLNEVGWRTYFRGWLVRRPAVWRSYLGALTAAQASLKASPVAERHARAIAGQSGFACLDAWCDELRRTGYLHNHARMWFASLWIYGLGLPWVLGADFFQRHLVDGDAASNTLSWRWVAGLHTPGKRYLATAANIERFTRGRLQADFPTLSAALAPPAEPLGEALPLSVPEPPDRSRRTALLLTADDLGGLERGPLATAYAAIDAANRVPVALIALTGATRPLGTLGSTARGFLDGAAADAKARLGDAGIDAAIAVDPPASALADFARGHGVTQVLCAEPVPGAAADWLAAAWAAWPDGRVAGLRSAWDHALWPHANRGFFPFAPALAAAGEALARASPP